MDLSFTTFLSLPIDRSAIDCLDSDIVPKVTLGTDGNHFKTIRSRIEYEFRYQ
jgi:hypothetical protein